jgi:hypothetical protein
MTLAPDRGRDEQRSRQTNVHVPAAQTCPGAHALPQPPQFFRSLFKSAHRHGPWLHSVMPAEHVQMHEPEVQT